MSTNHATPFAASFFADRHDRRPGTASTILVACDMANRNLRYDALFGAFVHPRGPFWRSSCPTTVSPQLSPKRRCRARRRRIIPGSTQNRAIQAMRQSQLLGLPTTRRVIRHNSPPEHLLTSDFGVTAGLSLHLNPRSDTFHRGGALSISTPEMSAATYICVRRCCQAAAICRSAERRCFSPSLRLEDVHRIAGDT